MVQKLAIVISGAVSLGSYEAGVMYEIIEAIAQHNQHPKTTDSEKIEIDVIAGASAGAMTAAILTQKLLFAGDELRDPKTNPLFRAWVEDADIKDLLKQMEGDDPSQSIFSSALIAKIGKRYLLERYQGKNTSKVQQRHPATATKIHLGIAMSNLNGIDYTVQLTHLSAAKAPEEPNRFFTYTNHQDCAIYSLDPESDQEAKWQEIELRARSSGAFPFAFRVLPVERHKDEEVFAESEFAQGNSPTQFFAYTDGGVFENEPLGLAKRLVNQIDRNPRDYENRFFLYVSPGAKQSTVSKFNASQATYLKTGEALLGAIFGQARFQDWIKTSDINTAIQRFDRQAIALKDLLKQHPEQESAFGVVATSLLDALYASAKPEDELRNQAQERLRQQFHDEYHELVSTQNENVAENWLKAILALEKASELGPRDLMRVYTITSTNKELSGEELSAFGGFFSQTIREHDYKLGRRKAVDFLNGLQDLDFAQQHERQLFLKRFKAGQDIGQINPELGELKISELPLELREELRDAVLKRVLLIVDSLNVQAPIAKFLFKLGGYLVVGKEVNQLLGTKFYFCGIKKFISFLINKKSSER